MGQGTVAENPDVLLNALLLDSVFNGPPQQAIGYLIRFGAADGQHVRQVLDAKIRDANSAYFALFAQPLQRPHGLGQGSATVGPMDLVEIDVIGLEPPQAVLTGLLDRCA